MTDKSLQGTGHVFAEFDLGELGSLKIEDDGDGDACVRVGLYDSDGLTRSILSDHLYDERKDRGDTAFAQQIEAAVSDDGNESDSAGVKTRQTAFKCDDCNRTWPGKRNQNPGSGADICPECDDDD